MEEQIVFTLAVSDMREIAKEIVSYRITAHSMVENTDFLEKIQKKIMVAMGLLTESEDPELDEEEDYYE